MREKLIELIGQAQDCGCDVTDVVEMNYVENETLVDHLIANGVTIQRWIPVTERLPDWRDGKVLVFTKYGFSVCERTVNSRWQGNHARWITHWMPLPEPPKEERRTDNE